MTINYRRWTTKQIATLRDLAERRLSAAVIAEHVGVTKNAVIGQCFRSGIKLKGLPCKRAIHYNFTRKLIPIVEPPPPALPDPSKFIPLEFLKNHHCRQVVSNTNYGLAMFCGSPKSKPHSYCAYHAARNFRPT